MNILQELAEENASFALDFYEVEWIRENLPLIEVEDIPVEYIELLEVVEA